MRSKVHVAHMFLVDIRVSVCQTRLNSPQAYIQMGKINGQRTSLCAAKVKRSGPKLVRANTLEEKYA